jgi:hypothetical protein
MKNIFLIFISWICFLGFPQKKSNFQPELNVFFNVEKGVGNNHLNKAHNFGRGLGVEFYIFNFSKFKLGTGMQYNYFGVNDASFIGNYSSTRFMEYYLLISYDQKILNKFSIEPCIQFGKSYLKQIADNRIYNTNSYGSQPNINFGLNINYSLSNKTVVFIRPIFVSRNFDMNTIAEYQDFFNENRTIVLNFGIKFLFHK